MTLDTNQIRTESDKVFAGDQVVQVLALDGGGLKGLFTAAVIESLEEQLGSPLSRHFDIITGTSTGGLIALGMGIGKSGNDMVRFYQDHGPKIFPNQGLQRFIRYWLSWFWAKYPNRPLEETLKMLLVVDGSDAEPILGDSRKRLIIPTLLAASSKPRLLKTPHDKRLRLDWKMPMWSVAMATAAAPTYLPSFEYNGQTYLDGGLWANNPSLIGVVEALQMGASLENIRVLNISTTSSSSDCLVFKFPFTRAKKPFTRLGRLPWASRILSVVMGANSYSTPHMYLRQMLAPGNLAVIDEPMNAGHAELDDINYKEFYSRGRSAGEQAKSQIEYFFEHIAPDYVPSREALGDAIER